MGLLSRVARAAGKVVSVVGGQRGEDVVQKARGLRDKLGGRPGEGDSPDEGARWPGALSSVWSRGSDLLGIVWRDGSDDLLAQWSEVGENLRQGWQGSLGPAALELQASWLKEGETFRQAWDALGKRLVVAWDKAIQAPDSVEAEGILDSAIQDGWRQVREAWIPVRLGLRDAIERARVSTGGDAAAWASAGAHVDASWGKMEALLSDRFRNEGSYLVSAVREVAEGQGQPGEVLDAIQRLSHGMDSAWKEGIRDFRDAWTRAAVELFGKA